MPRFQNKSTVAQHNKNKIKHFKTFFPKLISIFFYQIKKSCIFFFKSLENFDPLKPIHPLIELFFGMDNHLNHCCPDQNLPPKAYPCP